MDSEHAPYHASPHQPSSERIALKQRIMALAAQAYGLRNNNSHYAKEYVAEALKLAEEAAFSEGIAESVLVSGVVHCCAAEYDVALRHLAKAVELYEALGQDSAFQKTIALGGQSRATRWMGIVYRNIGMPVTGVEYCNQSLVLAEESNNQTLVGFALMVLGDCYVTLNENEKAKAYRTQALAIASGTDDKELQSQALWSMARSAEMDRQYEQAYQYYHQSYLLRETVGDYLGMGTARFGMASVMEKQGKRARALRIYMQLWANFKSNSSGVPQTEAFITMEIGRLYAASVKPERALPYLRRALTIGQKVGVQPIIASANEALANFYKQIGDFETALLHFEEFHRINADIAQRESKQTIQYFRQAFDFERAQKETEIYRLRNEELATAYAQNERLLLNVLPEAIAVRMKAGETTIAERFSDVTVLFADIVGFTELSAHRSPEEVVDILNRIFSAFDIFSEQYNLEKIKTIGDAYMIVGGAPNPCDDHAESVARLALEMHETVNLLSRSMGLDIALRIGMHTGAVVAGIIGQKKFTYDLWGDTVNTASRMESHGEAGKIHCTETVMKRLEGRYVFEQREPLEVKGKGLMTTYFLMGKR
ncbi:MAG: tetratricopeptide repeat protein [Candidatus Kapabacteria bacterium]|nr:tetratricopeptide repeat protein [Candidatus Kapabacteria bacterium]